MNKQNFISFKKNSEIKDRCVLKLVELNSTNTEATKWPSSNAVEVPKHAESLINEYYSPSVSMRQQQTGFTATSTNPYQYNTNVAVPSASHRSSSEPRFNPAPVLSSNHVYNQSNAYNSYSNQATQYSKPTYVNDFQDFNNKYETKLSSETYDNLSDHNTKQPNHQSRVDTNFNQLTNIYDKYSSIRSNTIKSAPTSALLKKERDIKSVDRDLAVANNRLPRRNSAITSTSSPNAKETRISMGLSAKQRNLDHLRDLKSCDRDFLNHRSGSVTPKLDLTEDEDDDESNATNSLSYATKRLSTFQKNDLLNDETDAENSKLKMKLMQDQLEKLTNLVHKALANRDLNQLAVQCDLQNMFDIDFTKSASLTTNNRKFYTKSQNKNLNDLNTKTKMLRNDLSNIKKLQETFNSSFGDSMKTFANQLNVS